METRVPVEDMLPLERAAHEVGAVIYGLKCDTPDCGWEDMTVPLDAYGLHLMTKCPKCGAHVLTQQDMLMVMSSVFGAAATKAVS